LACPSIIADLGLCEPVDIYCERLGPGLWAEPLNALSNAAFFVAALAAVWLLARHAPQRAHGLIRWLIAIVALIGAGSLLFHTVATSWAVWGDVIPILLFMLLYLWLVLRKFFAWPSWLALFGVAAFFAATLMLEVALPPGFPVPGAMYLPALIVLIATAAALLPRQPQAGHAMLVASAVFLISFALRSADQLTCASIPVGTHFLWHLLNGLLLFLLMRLAILYMPKAR